MTALPASRSRNCGGRERIRGASVLRPQGPEKCTVPSGRLRGLPPRVAEELLGTVGGDHSSPLPEQSPPSCPTNPGAPIPDPDAFAERKQLVEAALRLDAGPKDPPSAEAVCAEAGIDVATFYVHFDAPEALFPAFYDLTVDQYRLLSAATEGYEDFSFEERLASFYYILLDALAEHRGFVRETFDTRVRSRSQFRGEVRTALRALLTDDSIPQPNRLVTGLWPVQKVLTEVTFAVVRHWIGDESEDQAATTALVDKLVAFVAELVTFRGVSRGLDLAWYIVQNDALGLRRLPVVGRFLPGREHTD